ncbi:unnamed protein product [Bursaphelenchus xylophilus]|uniref:(pine wood nematode) hypothetical protein n=1 Tax=Bursaphelenchus xylophilus TaxID=6326 RepID=A0A1I7RTM5_BURXY|nr:unnamed protein product [Bursaphelenchus xylophilus]CAG9122314.1 unnamed protein product [Bursaphelenchus xylophilus]
MKLFVAVHLSVSFLCLWNVESKEVSNKKLLLKESLKELLNADNVSTDARSTLKLAEGLIHQVEDHEHDDLLEFFGFISKFNRRYADSKEVESRFRIIQESLRTISKLRKASPSAEFGLTARSDLSKAEHSTCARFSKMNSKEFSHALPNFAVGEAPSTFDWRDHNGVTSVKDQDQCGSCFAFAATAAIESQWLVHRNKSLDLSEEQILQCTYNVSGYDAMGCDGGDPAGVLRYVRDHGVTDEAHSPYNISAEMGHCNRKVPIVANISHIVTLSNYDEDQLRDIIYNVGPVVVGADATFLINYHRGVISLQSDEWNVDHAVVIVGYGEEGSFKYWVLKNSWAETWGEKGYFRVERGLNVLGVAKTLMIAFI